MSFKGLGIVSACGRGRECHELALESAKACASDPGQPPTSGLVAKETLKDKAILRNMRRADRFSKMAVLAACDALHDAGIELADDDQSLGIVVTTSLGPHDTTFKFLDDILDYADTEVSPTKFSHSVHNAAASYIASALGSRGPTTTVTRFGNAFRDGLVLGDAWLRQERCRYVAVGYVEERSLPMEYIDRKLREEGRVLQQFSLALGSAVPFSEGAVFVVLSGPGGLETEEVDRITDMRSLLEVLGKNNE